MLAYSPLVTTVHTEPDAYEVFNLEQAHVEAIIEPECDVTITQNEPSCNADKICDDTVPGTSPFLNKDTVVVEADTSANVDVVDTDVTSDETDESVNADVVDIDVNSDESVVNADVVNIDVKSDEQQAIANDKSTDGTTVLTDAVDQKILDSGKSAVYEFPALTRLEPGRVGDEVEVELRPGKRYKRVTRAVRPPVFEIADFLDDAECDTIIAKATGIGMKTSTFFGVDVEESLSSGRNTSEIERISKTAWLKPQHFNAGDDDGDFLTVLHERLSSLTELPVGVILKSEPIQVVNYGPAGHYHAHLDTGGDQGLPCCFQADCKAKTSTPDEKKCCRLCRFITVLYFLNDVEEGGETAFPLADMPDDVVREKVDSATDNWSNLSLFCHNCSLVVAPKKGTAIMWYSHFIDDKGYLGVEDERSHHGGCDVIRGHKWIANNWISASTYEDRFKPSIYNQGPDVRPT